MGRVVIVAYQPRQGRERAFESAIRDHIRVLRDEGLVTERAPIVVRAQDGTYLEIFEWASADAIAAAHTNPAVQALWGRFGEACEYRKLTTLPEASDLFAEFEAVEL
jgi:quinol monooxygenase YgiN